MLEGFYLADHRVNFPNFGSFLISFLHSEKIKIFKNWYVVITTRITVTRDCNKIFLKSNYQKIFEIQIFPPSQKHQKLSCDTSDLVIDHVIRVLFNSSGLYCIIQKYVRVFKIKHFACVRDFHKHKNKTDYSKHVLF